MNVLKKLGRNTPVGPYFSKHPPFLVTSSLASLRSPSSHLSHSMEMGKLSRATNNCTSHQHQAKEEVLDSFASHNQLKNTREQCMRVVGTEDESYYVARQREKSWKNYESNLFYNSMKGRKSFQNHLVPPVPNIKSPLGLQRVMGILQKTWSNDRLEQITEALNYLCLVSDKRIVDFCPDIKQGICTILESAPDDKSRSIPFLCTLTYLDSFTLKKIRSCGQFSRALNTYCLALLPRLCADEIFRVFHCYRLIGNPTIQWANSFPRCALIALQHQMHTFTKDQLVQLCYFISVCRKRLTCMNELQQYIGESAEKMTLGELALVLSAFFKANVPITDNSILATIVAKAKQGRKTIDELYLVTIVKSLRFHSGVVKQPIVMLLLELVHLGKITTVSFSHLIHYAMTSVIYQEVLVREIRNRFASTIHSMRLKDIAKQLMYVCNVGYFSEHADAICNAAIDHLRSTRHTVRANEIKSYPFTFITCVTHLSSINKYDPELLDHIFNQVFLHCLRLDDDSWWEVWCLDRNIVIDLPEYRHSRFPESYRRHFAKITTRNCTAPSKDKRVYHFEQFVSSVAFTLKSMFGSASCVLVGRVLPQYTQSNIIICLDEATGRGVPIESDFLPEILLEPKFVKGNDVSWLAFELVTMTRMIHGSSHPYGRNQSKLRHLRSLGYIPHTIMESNWIRHVTESERVCYLGKLIANRNRASQQLN